jgi:N-glycosylase/DNA lyase
MNAAAFSAISQSGLFDRQNVESYDVAEVLLRPLPTASGRYIRYRFPYRRSDYIAQALSRLQHETLPTDNALGLREALLSFPGIGLKTASWITRNHLQSPQVAIIDIHVFRAGILMGLFSGKERLPSDYLHLEQRYLHFAEAAAVDPRELDLVIWSTMQQHPFLVQDAFDNVRLTSQRTKRYNERVEAA